MRLFPTIIVCFTASHAFASIEDLECGWDHGAGKVVPLAQVGDSVSVQPEPILPMSAGENFVAFHAAWGGIAGFEASAEISVIQNCNGGNSLFVENSASETRQKANETFDAMVVSEVGYSLTEIGEAMVGFGSSYWIGASSIGNCACDVANWSGSK